MTPRSCFLVLPFVAHALTSCASPHTFARMVQPEVTGPHASRLTRAEIVQIAEIPFTRADMPRKTVGSIYVSKPDEAGVQTVMSRWPDDKYVAFTVRKHAGRWTVVESSVH